jgi:DNA-binding HxlR family transcriptional regulator
MGKLGITTARSVTPGPDDVGNCYDARCPAREVLDHVFSRWGGLILGALVPGRKRYSELRVVVGGISEKMLAQTLRTLERDGLIVRESRPVVPPHVEYELTSLGRQCAERVSSVVSWIQSHVATFVTSQDAYDDRRSEASA